MKGKKTMPTANKTTGDKLKTLRELAEESIEQTAKMLGVSVSSLVAYENGDKVPRDEIKAKIAEHFNVPITELLRADQEGPGQGDTDNLDCKITDSAFTLHTLIELLAEIYFSADAESYSPESFDIDYFKSLVAENFLVIRDLVITAYHTSERLQKYLDEFKGD